MCTMRSKTLAGIVNGFEKFIFEFDATSASELPIDNFDGLKIANGSTGMITGSTDAGSFYIYDEYNKQWNKAGVEE